MNYSILYNLGVRNSSVPTLVIELIKDNESGANSMVMRGITHRRAGAPYRDIGAAGPGRLFM